MRTCAWFVSMVLLTSIAHADNWAHWRGPTGNGVALNANPPTEWSTTKNVKWKVAVPGKGSSSPIVWGDRVFVSSAVQVKPAEGGGLPTYDFKAFCFDRKTGNLIWEKTAITSAPHQGTHATNSFASASPCTDGERVYFHYGSRGLHCYTIDGEPVWHRQFGEMKTLNNFGEGSSPTLTGDKILVPWDHQGPSALFALNKKTGDIIWKEARDEPTGWCTPLVVENEGKKQIIMNGQNFARGYDLETGKEIWRCTGQTKRPVCSAVFANGIAYVGSGFQGAFIGAFKLTGKGDIQGTDKVIWTIKQDAPDIPTPLLTTTGRLYYYKGKSGLLTCTDAATGKQHYSAQRVDGVETPYGSPIEAGGNIYLTGRTGNIVVIKDSNELQVVSKNAMEEILNATPAPVDNELFIRGDDHLFCIARSGN